MSRDRTESNAIRLDALTRVLRLGGGLQTDVWLLAGVSAHGWPTRLVVKTLKPAFQTEHARDALRAEISAQRTIVHPNCVPLAGEARLGDAPALAMPLIDGVTLAQLRRVAATSPELIHEHVDAVRALASDLLLALAYLHDHPAGGRIHGDIKPGNIWLCVDGRARLGDFASLQCIGRLREADSPLNATPRYCRPQRLDGASASLCDDYFALATSLLTVLCGSAGSLAEYAAMVERLPAPVRSLTEPLVAACAAALGDDCAQASSALQAFALNRMGWNARCELAWLAGTAFRFAY